MQIPETCLVKTIKIKKIEQKSIKWGKTGQKFQRTLSRLNSVFLLIDKILFSWFLKIFRTSFFFVKFIIPNKKLKKTSE